MKRTPADLDINEWQDYIERFHTRWPYTVRFAMRIENTPLTSARYAGGMIYNGAHYTYFEPRIPGHEPNPGGTPYVAWLMVRDDFLRFVKAELNKEAKRAGRVRQRTTARTMGGTMTKIICDRCGKKISDTYEDPRYRVEMDAPRDACTVESFDLCEECKDALVAFIKGEEEQNHD